MKSVPPPYAHFPPAPALPLAHPPPYMPTGLLATPTPTPTTAPLVPNAHAPAVFALPAAPSTSASPYAHAAVCSPPLHFTNTSSRSASSSNSSTPASGAADTAHPAYYLAAAHHHHHHAMHLPPGTAPGAAPTSLSPAALYAFPDPHLYFPMHSDPFIPIPPSAAATTHTGAPGAAGSPSLVAALASHPGSTSYDLAPPSSLGVPPPLASPPSAAALPSACPPPPAAPPPTDASAAAAPRVGKKRGRPKSLGTLPTTATASAATAADPATAPAAPIAAAARVKKSTRVLLSTDMKKRNHIASEQKRRQNIRIGFDRLVELVPGLSRAPRSESLILQKSIEYIQTLLAQHRAVKTEYAQYAGFLTEANQLIQPDLVSTDEDESPEVQPATKIRTYRRSMYPKKPSLKRDERQASDTSAADLPEAG